MKKKTIAVVCAVLAVVVAGGGLLWYFLRDNAASEDESVVYVNTVAQLTGISQGNGLQNRFAGVVESKNTWKVEKNAEKTVQAILKAARTGEIGDGRIFVIPIEDAIRIRTAERGDIALYNAEQEK